MIKPLSIWASEFDMPVGAQFTIAGKYRRRTLWEWLTRQPRELQVWRIVENV